MGKLKVQLHEVLRGTKKSSFQIQFYLPHKGLDLWQEHCYNKIMSQKFIKNWFSRRKDCSAPESLLGNREIINHNNIHEKGL